MEQLSTWAETNNKTLYQSLDHAEEIIGAGERRANAVTGFKELIDRSAGRLRRKGNLTQATGQLVQDGAPVSLFHQQQVG